VLPNDSRFVALVASWPYETTSGEDEPHTMGQAFCQALARAEHRGVTTRDFPVAYPLALATYSATGWPAAAPLSDAANAIVGLDLQVGAALSFFSGLEMPLLDHELTTALALHGITADTSGRAASVSLTLGGWRTFVPGDNTTYVVASGINTRYALRFSKTADMGQVCHVEHEVTWPVEVEDAMTVTTRWRFRPFDYAKLVADCGVGAGPLRLYVDVLTCGGYLPCDGAGAAGVTKMSGSTFWIDVDP
jgi:hypothetical protein